MKTTPSSQPAAPPSPETCKALLLSIAAIWPELIHAQPRTNGTLIGVPYPFVVPTNKAMFAREMYAWDSFFISLGLVDTPHERMIRGMAENQAYLFGRFGLIPNANRYYFLGRSQPPLFTRLAWLAYEVVRRRDGEAAARGFLDQMMRVARAEHKTVWLGDSHPHARLVYRGLSRYYDVNVKHDLACCESGWDHSTRCDERWLDHLPIDLNSILYRRELDIAAAAELLGEPKRAATWRGMAERRKQTVNELMYDPQAGFFFDYDYAAERINPHPSLAGFFPLWTGLATKEQAKRVVTDWLPKFQRPGGLVTTLEEKAGRQWAAPNGWAPLQWVVAEGLDEYGFHAEARGVRATWVANVAATHAATGLFFEKYNVVSPAGNAEPGVYGQLSGFGWTNAVVADFIRRLDSAPTATPACSPSEPHPAEAAAVAS